MAESDDDLAPRRRPIPGRPIHGRSPRWRRTRRLAATAAGVGVALWIGTADTPLRDADGTPTYADMGAALAQRYPVTATHATELVRIVHEEADRQRLDPCLVMGVIAKESAFRTHVRNRGDLGLMQLNVDWHAERVARAGGQRALMEPRRNVRAGTELLADYRRLSRSDREALQRYHGLGKRGDYPARVEALANELQAAGACLAAAAAAGDPHRPAAR